MIGYKDGVQTGTFEYGNDGTYIYIVYSTGDVTISGTEVMDNYYIRSISCYMKKGWNLMAEIDMDENADGIHIAEFTTMLPDGIQCYFDADENGGGTVPGAPSPVGNKITAAVVNGASLNTAIDGVVALTNATYSSGGGNFWWTDDVVGSGTYAGGGFTVDLATTVDAQYLEPFDADDFDESVTLSDPNAMTGGVDYLVAYKSDDQVGKFRYCNYAPTGEDPITRIEATFVYTDRDVTVTGSGDDNRYTYNVSLKKG